MEGLNNNQRFQGLENFKLKNRKNKVNNKGLVKVSPDDPYMKWPLRGLAYTNEIGEVIRPMSGVVANLLWVPAIAYIGADVMDKYKQSPEGDKTRSKRRAVKQFSFQMLASVILPTLAVKAGQKITNALSAISGNKLSLNHKKEYSEKIMESLDKGTYRRYLDENGRIDKKRYTEHFMNNIAAEASSDKLEHEMSNPIRKGINKIKKFIYPEAKASSVEKYISHTVNNLVDITESLADGNKPAKISRNKFRAFEKVAKSTGSIKDKYSAAASVAHKFQESKIFKNNAILSLGGFIALAAMIKPIDYFVEHVLIKKGISPAVDWVSDKLKDDSAEQVIANKMHLTSQK